MGGSILWYYPLILARQSRFARGPTCACFECVCVRERERERKAVYALQVYALFALPVNALSDAGTVHTLDPPTPKP